MHWQNRLFLTFESLTLHVFFLDSVKQCYLQTKKHALTSSERAHSITWYKQKGFEISERQNRCHGDIVSRMKFRSERQDVFIYLVALPYIALLYIALNACTEFRNNLITCICIYLRVRLKDIYLRNTSTITWKMHSILE